MSRHLPRASFNSSRLIRLLAELVAEAVGDPRQVRPAPPPFAERLGQWLGFTDAIALSGALNAKPGRTPDLSLCVDEAQPERAALNRVRAALIASIRGDSSTQSGRARIRLPAQPRLVPEEGAAEVVFSPYRRYYMAHQREIASALGQLRADLRAALARCSPALAQLAAIDGVLDQALGERERNLLAGIPDLLEQHFVRLRSKPATGLPALGWLNPFVADMQAILFAELELRLQPALGLLAALEDAPSS
ncbi:MAG: DUF3348 domain-containing protein [Zoogloeaceae bacterium]|nr:DUF3348 domain-containing protein [Zoogloeaceae bacterium]